MVVMERGQNRTRGLEGGSASIRRQVVGRSMSEVGSRCRCGDCIGLTRKEQPYSSGT